MLLELKVITDCIYIRSFLDKRVMNMLLVFYKISATNLGERKFDVFLIKYITNKLYWTKFPILSFQGTHNIKESRKHIYICYRRKFSFIRKWIDYFTHLPIELSWRKLSSNLISYFSSLWNYEQSFYLSWLFFTKNIDYENLPFYSW